MLVTAAVAFVLLLLGGRAIESVALSNECDGTRLGKVRMSRLVGVVEVGVCAVGFVFVVVVVIFVVVVVVFVVLGGGVVVVVVLAGGVVVVVVAAVVCGGVQLREIHLQFGATAQSCVESAVSDN
jgi:hypothetical protein